MKIFVDADVCPVVRIVEEVAERYRINVTLLCDTNHILTFDYSEVIVVGAGADAVDYKLISICHKGDIVVSQNYGVAAMVLGKGAYAIHQSGKWDTNENIDQMLMERHLNKKARRGSHKNHLKGPKKRTEKDDKKFAQSDKNKNYNSDMYNYNNADDYVEDYAYDEFGDSESEEVYEYGYEEAYDDWEEEMDE